MGSRAVGGVLLVFGLAWFSLAIATSQSAHAFDVPDYQGFVNDFAAVLSSAQHDALERRLEALAAKENGVEIAVVTVAGLEGESLADVSQQFFDTWQIGKADSDNGVLLLLAMEEREVRIQTGYGAEVFLTDAAAGRIIRNEMHPLLRANDPDQAISRAVDAIAAASAYQMEVVVDEGLNGEELAGQLMLVPTIFIFFSTIVTYLFAFLGRSKSWWPGGVVGAIIGWILGALQSALVLGVIGLVLDYILSRNYKKWNMEHRTTSWRKTWGGFHGGKPPIRFGGGMSGGGGASGKW